MLLVGLTGGIGSGKSTVAQKLVERGATLLDADGITRELQAPGQQVFEQIVAYFGPSVLANDGTLDRATLADIVFDDPAERKVLESLVHPAVGATIAERMAALAGTDRVVILDIPLLVEHGRDDLVATIVVDLDVDTAVERLIGRGLAETDARRRIALQASREERRSAADFVVDNSGTVADLDRQIDRCWEWLETLQDPTTHEPGRPVKD